MPQEPQSVKLRGGLENTASTVRVEDDGRLVIEFYDFSSEAQSAFGNDVAYLVTVAPAEVSRVALLLGVAENEAAGPPLLERMNERFFSYFDAKKWLDENAIPYVEAFDSWA